MKAYLAVVFAKQSESRAYLLEVAIAIKSVAGMNLKYGEAAASVAAIAFLSDESETSIRRAFKDLWRVEQRTWIFPLESPVMVDAKLMEWVRKHCPA
jgi:hypothetical protein